MSDDQFWMRWSVGWAAFSTLWAAVYYAAGRPALCIFHLAVVAFHAALILARRAS